MYITVKALLLQKKKKVAKINKYHCKTSTFLAPLRICVMGGDP